jgi:ATP-dependent Clp protease ATP-binding subunit ClpA
VFERFTPAARQAVARAQHEAQAFAHPWIGTEHLLLGVLAADSPGAVLLAEAGVTLDSARAALETVVGRGGFCEHDAAALRSVGIDLDQVRHAAEATFGPGALDRPPAWRCRRRSPFRHRRRQLDATPDELPFMPRAKRALERASTEAEHSRHGQLDLDQLLLGLLDRKGNMAVELIQHLGANPEVMRAQLRARLDDAA